MPAVRTQNKPLPRLTSPFLPASVMPRIDSRQGSRHHQLRLLAEEEERAVLNEQVYMNRALANRFPDDAIKAMEFKFSLDDYEERFGKFNELTERRQDVVYLSHISHKSELLQYFEDFEAEFGFQFEVDDNMRKILSNKEKILAEYTTLMDRVDGDRGAACDIAGNGYRFTVKNPFPGADERRAEFDTTLRRIYARCRLDGASPHKATLNAKLFVFDLPNTHPERHDEHLTYYCQWEWVLSGVASGFDVVSPPPLPHDCFKARRSLKCLPLLPRSPFDRKVRRRAPKVRPAMRSAAPAVLPMRVSCYDTCVQFRAVLALSSLSAGEGCEHPWHFLMYTMYLNTMSPLLYRMVYAPATESTTVAIRRHRAVASIQALRASLLAVHDSFMAIRERFATDLHAATASFNF
ncbi:hypothetical protein B0H17DRAFT_1214854 [Mycena rosella]|uniref:Uncharacterized protein n=1 Tax=Mycena rosella TaxID=1033263 RepID=A0AAD7CM12_MYCRO|nr:hypothetical protein B0H17DRAFT_1214854 [Mycena rosella]